MKKRPASTLASLSHEQQAANSMNSQDPTGGASMQMDGYPSKRPCPSSKPCISSLGAAAANTGDFIATTATAFTHTTTAINTHHTPALPHTPLESSCPSPMLHPSAMTHASAPAALSLQQEPLASPFTLAHAAAHLPVQTQTMTPAPSHAHLPDLSSHAVTSSKVTSSHSSGFSTTTTAANKKSVLPTRPIFHSRSTALSVPQLMPFHDPFAVAPAPSASRLFVHRSPFVLPMHPRRYPNAFVFHHGQTYHVGDYVALKRNGRYGMIQKFHLSPKNEKQVYIQDLECLVRHPTAPAAERQWLPNEFAPSAGNTISVILIDDIDCILLSTAFNRPGHMAIAASPPMHPVPTTTEMKPTKRKRSRSWHHDMRDPDQRMFLLKTVFVRPSSTNSIRPGSAAWDIRETVSAGGTPPRLQVTPDGVCSGRTQTSYFPMASSCPPTLRNSASSGVVSPCMLTHEDVPPILPQVVPAPVVAESTHAVEDESMEAAVMLLGMGRQHI